MGDGGEQAVFPMFEEALEGVGVEIDSAAIVGWGEVVGFEDVGVDEVGDEGIDDEGTKFFEQV